MTVQAKNEDLAAVRAAFFDLAEKKGQPRPPVKQPSMVNVLRASDIVPERIHWLWPDWLPAGKLSILAGDAGAGKTTLALALAATVTTGGRWPDGTHCEQPGNVVIWSGEDNPADTLVPRLIAAGADCDRCFFVDGVTEGNKRRAFDPAIDMLQLASLISDLGGASLLIVDPIVSAVTGNMDKANDVRRSLQSLVDIASAHDCAVLGITHFTKGSAGSSPLHRVTGSQAFGALARMVLVAGKTENGADRAMTRAKSNIAPDGGGVTYTVELTEIVGGIPASRALWGSVIEGSAREILGDMEYRENDDGSERADAERFLRDLLSDGPLPTKQIEADAKGAGYSWATIRRAQKSLGVEVQRHGIPGQKGKGEWRWGLPDGLRCSSPSLYVATRDGEHLNQTLAP
ncbi:AAA family ATPase [Burkholderia cenocepacia]|uniref:AAA family ATPase n=1 Tax=Burkholderia cenocepacia TaxID=95486 RepID=UPI001CF3CC1C|nr:AAA family ATPase [Burkholderia cenocepacia]MCA7968228.1 AAA family ATPase [Burkholderia cenocepacia]